MEDPFLEFLKHRDHARYSKFVTSYIACMVRVAHRYVRRADLAEDVVQDALLRLSSDRIGPNKVRHPRAYVLRTVANIACNLVEGERARERHEATATRTRGELETSAAQRAQSKEEVERVYAAIDRLPQEFRVAIHLRALEGLSYREIAMVTGARIETVSSRIQRARQLLKKSLGTTTFSVLGARLLGSRSSEAFLSWETLPALERFSPERWLFRRSTWLGLASVVSLVAIGLILRESEWAVSGQVLTRIVRERLANREGRPPDSMRDGLRDQSARHSELTLSVDSKPDDGGKLMGRSTTAAAASLTIGLAALGSPGYADPGEAIALLPAGIRAPTGLAFDSSDGTFWVASFVENRLWNYSGDLRNKLGSLSLPFDNPRLSFATGIALNSADGTLLVLDSLGRRIHEISRDGTPTGKFISVPFPTAGEPLGGIAFDPGGDAARGSIYVVQSDPPLILEVSLAGDRIRAFPDPDDGDRLLGDRTRVQIFDVDPIFEDGTVRGFWVSASISGRYLLLELDERGTWTGASVPLRAAGGQVFSVRSRQFPDPNSGELRDTYVCTVQDGSFAVLAGGIPDFLPIHDLRCAATNQTVTLSWTRAQIYDAIEVFDSCELIAVASGDADEWQGEFAPDERYDLSVRAVSGARTMTTGPCQLALGVGQVLASTHIPAPPPITGGDLAYDRRDRLVVAQSGRMLQFFGLDLTRRGKIEVSEFFGVANESITNIAYGGEPGTFLIYSAWTEEVGLINDNGILLDSFPLEVERRRVLGLTFDDAADGDFGALTAVLEYRGTRERVIAQFDPEGFLIDQAPHPFVALDTGPDGCSNGPEIGGIANVTGGESGEFWVAGRTTIPRNRWNIVRTRFDDEGTVDGVEIPAPYGLGLYYSHETVAVDGGQRLFALTSDARSGATRLSELRTEIGPVSPLARLSCSQSSNENRVELRFSPTDSYDTIEIRRDCELLAVIDGDATTWGDTEPLRGVHEYRVRGTRDGIASGAARCTLRVGIGSLLQQAAVCGMSIDQLSIDPVDGTLWAAARVPARVVAHYDVDLTLLETRPAAVAEPWAVDSLAIRISESGEREIYQLVRHAKAQLDGPAALVVETLSGRLLRELPLDPPRLSNSYSDPTALVWSATTDTFFYSERKTRQIVEIRTDGTTRRQIAHPAPPQRFEVRDRGLTLNPQLGTLLISTAGAGETNVTRIVELDLDGQLTGHEIPVLYSELGQGVRGFALSGHDVIAAAGDELLRIKAFDARSVRGFIRGDANADSNVELSDAVFTLNHLFLGGSQPVCEDATDTNDDGRVDLSDAIRLLNYLFLGGPSPVTPFPGAGPDPTADDLRCRDT